MPLAPHFVTVFDISRVSFVSWMWWGAIALLVVPSTAAGWKSWHDENDQFAVRNAVIGFAFALFAGGMVLLLYLAALAHFHSLQAALMTRRYNVVEGVVTNFRYGRPDRFDVGNLEFTYSPNDMTSMFNTTTAGGLPIINGRHVRIAYDSNDILRLDVAQ
jgi:hypothetical protein